MLSVGDYTLRPIEEKDLEIVLKWRNSDRIRKNMYTDNIIAMEEHLNWYRNMKKDNASYFNIFEYKERPAGVVHFYHIDKRNNKCVWGFYLGEDFLPKGTGLMMGYLGLTFVFEHLGIRKLNGEAFVFNEASIKFHRKLGFIEEGRWIKHILKNEKYEDILSFAMFQEDWLNNKKQIEKMLDLH